MRFGEFGERPLNLYLLYVKTIELSAILGGGFRSRSAGCRWKLLLRDQKAWQVEVSSRYRRRLVKIYFGGGFGSFGGGFRTAAS